MAASTIERAFELARAGEARNFTALKERLKAEGCRAVDALLSAQSIRGHLQAICLATYKPEGVAPEPAETPDNSESGPWPESPTTSSNEKNASA
jgi:hypothetical protein